MLKKAVSVLLVFSMIFSLCNMASVSAETATMEWNFNTDSDQEGWLANKGTLAVAGGVMKHTVSAGQSNAFLLSPNNLNIDGGNNRYVKIRLKNSNCASTTCVVSFTTDTDTSWDTLYSTGTKSVMTAEGISGYDEDYTEYVIDMSGNENWMNGSITRFRLLTFLNTPSITAGSMDIDYIKVSDTPGDTQPTKEPEIEETAVPTKEPEIEETAAPTTIPTDKPEDDKNKLKWDFETDADQEGWVANKGTLSVAGGIMTHTVSAGQSNAFLLSPNNLNIDGGNNRYVKIRLKNNNCASTSCVVSFITDSDSAWDTLYSTGSKSVMTDEGITGYDSVYTEYVIDMGGNENWMNGSITRFRLLTFLNTPSITAGSMDIDYIEVTNEPGTVKPTTPPVEEPTALPTTEPTQEPVQSKITLTASGTEAGMVGSYVLLTAQAEAEGLTKLELYDGETIIHTLTKASITDYPYELTHTGQYSFTAKAYYQNGETSVSEQVTVDGVTEGRKEREYAEKYTFESDVEGFIARDGYSELSLSDGSAMFEIDLKNAYMYKSGMSIDLSKGSYVLIKMKNTTDDSKIILQWKTAEDNTFTEDKKITFSGVDSNDTPITTKDIEYKEYVFYMGNIATWADKNLTYLQIYPAADADSGAVYIDEIIFSDMQSEPSEVPKFSINADSGEKVFTDDKITLSAEVGTGEIEKVVYYNGTRKLGEAVAAPYALEYVPNSAEKAEFWAVAFDEYGAIIKSDNTISIDFKNYYDISKPVITNTGDGTEISVKIVQNTDVHGDMILVTALYDSEGNMIALKSSEAADDNTAAVSFTKAQRDEAVQALVTVIKSLSDAKCYTSAFMMDF